MGKGDRTPYLFLMFNLVCCNMNVLSYKIQPISLHRLIPLRCSPGETLGEKLSEDLKKKFAWANISPLEASSLKDAADLSLETFYKPRLNLNESGMESFEQFLAKGLISTFTKFERGDAWLSNYLGFRNRCGSRLQMPSISLSSDALIITAMTEDIKGKSVLVGLVEISVELPSGKLPTPLRFDSRKKEVLQSDEYQAYLSNLSVSKEYRRYDLGFMFLLIEVFYS